MSNLAFKKAMQVGSTWTRTNHVNPRASTPVAVTVIKVTPSECILRQEDGTTSGLTWPQHVAGMTAAPDGEGWRITDGAGRLVLTYAPAQPAPSPTTESRSILDDMLPGSSDEPEPDEAPPAQTKTLGEILGVLPPEVEKQVMRLMTAEVDELDLAKQFKALLVPHRAALETVGILPEYLAYMLIYVRQQG